MSETENHSNIAIGGGILTIALFGLSKQLGWETNFDWFDGVFAAIGVTTILMGIVAGRMGQALISVAALLSVLAYRHDLFQVDFGILFFAILLIVGGGLVFNGMMGNKSGGG